MTKARPAPIRVAGRAWGCTAYCCFLAWPGGRQPLSFFASPGGQSLALLPMVLPDDELDPVDEPVGDVAVLPLEVPLPPSTFTLVVLLLVALASEDEPLVLPDPELALGLVLVLVLPDVPPVPLPLVPEVLPVLPSVVPVLPVALVDGLVLPVEGVVLVDGLVALVEPELPIVDVLLPAEPGVTIAPPLDGRAPLVLAPGPVVTLVSLDSVPLAPDEAPDWVPRVVLVLADCA
jgi:signal-induced proliferation-associated 1 like protein 3